MSAFRSKKSTDINHGELLTLSLHPSPISISILLADPLAIFTMPVDRGSALDAIVTPATASTTEPDIGLQASSLK